MGRRSSGHSDSALSSFFSTSQSQQKGEPNQLTPGDRHPTPHHPAALPPSAHQLVYSFLPTLSVVPSTRPRRGTAPRERRRPPFPPVRVRIRSQPATRARAGNLLSFSLSAPRSSDRELPCAVPAVGRRQRRRRADRIRRQPVIGTQIWSVCRDFVIPPCWQDGVCVRALGVAICSLLDA